MKQNTYRRRGFFSDESGTAAIEFAVIATVLCLLFIGIADFGLGYWNKIQVGNAARAGGAYAIAKGWNQTDIATAVTNATTLTTISATPAPTEFCGCPNASSGISTATCGSSCTGGGSAGTYVTVNAQASYASIISYPGIPNPQKLIASTTVRIN